MDIDITTYEDLSLFSHEEEFSIFHKLDFTRTTQGKDLLLEYFNRPHNNLETILETQKVISLMLSKIDQWPASISNGTIMVIERFYETAVDEIPEGHNLPAALAYKVFHGPDYSIVRYSVTHFADFVRGLHQLVNLLEGPDCPPLLGNLLQRIKKDLDQDILQSLARLKPGVKLNPVQVI
ncbi:MAG TPA: DNA mismatch repair protein MutS, partial [Puia sp.]